MTYTIRDALEAAADTALCAQHIDGSFPAGHNGPYRDPESPVRNTAHWLVVLCHVYRETKEPRWRTSAERAVDYLLSDAARPAGGTFHCRTKPGKDSCNGLIGQAWALEGLIAAADALRREDARMAARDVFLLHPFDELRAVWARVEPDGRVLSADGTFNHQLWFAAVGAMLRDPDADRQALRFLDDVGARVETYRTGIVYHASPIELPRPFLGSRLLGAARWRAYRWRRARAMRRKSIGYHAFNLYGYALLKRRFPDHPFWTSPDMERMLAVSMMPWFKRALDGNPYGYPYNPPGFELAFAGEVFGLGREYATAWIDAQVAHTRDPGAGSLLTRSVPDERTSAARIYEATRLEGDYEVRTDA